MSFKSKGQDANLGFVWLLIAFIGVGIASIEIFTLGHLKASLVSNIQLNRANIGLASIVRTLVSTIRLIDAFFFSLVIGCVLVAFIYEAKKCLLSNFLNWVFARDRRLYLLLFSLGAVGTLYYWVPGYILASDASSHVPGAYFVTDALKNSHSLSWWNYWSLGGPSFLQFYGPLYFLLAGAMGVILGDATLGTKAVLWAVHVLSGFATFLYVRQISKSTSAALISGIVYVFAFAHTHLILWKGALPQSLIFLFFPLAIYYLDRYLRGDGPQHSLYAFTAVSTLLVISHPGMGVYSGWFILLYILVQVAINFELVKTKIMPLALSGLSSIAICSFVVVPMRFEMAYSISAGQLSQSIFPGIELPTLRTLMHALVWYNAATGEGHDNMAYLGLAAVMLGLFALWYYLPKRNGAVISLTTLLVAALVIRASHMRESIFVLTAISALAGMGVLALEDIHQSGEVSKLGRKLQALVGPHRHRLTVVILGLVLMDLAPTTIQSLYRKDKEYVLDMGRKLEKTIGSDRVVEGEAKEDVFVINTGSGGSPLMYFRVPMVFGPYLTGPWTQNYATVLVSHAFSEINKNRTLSETTLQGLQLFGVKYILMNGRSRYVLPNLIPASGYALNESVPALEISNPRFVWFSTAVSSRYDTSNDLETLLIGENGVSDPKRIAAYTKQVYKLIGDMELDSEKGVAKRFFVKHTADYALNQAPPVDPKLEVSKVSFDASRVAVDVTTNVPGFVQLSYPYYPYFEVVVNGVKTEPLVGAIPFIVVPVRPGKNNITITPYLSPIRKVTLLISGFTALGLLAVWLRLLRA